uniref:Uncharacterized protein n=1 Tax=viral metagenome TaxID=1070528 RepID=A0A6M3KFW3_9ZZZZ
MDNIFQNQNIFLNAVEPPMGIDAPTGGVDYFGTPIYEHNLQTYGRSGEYEEYLIQKERMGMPMTQAELMTAKNYADSHYNRDYSLEKQYDILGGNGYDQNGNYIAPYNDNTIIKPTVGTGAGNGVNIAGLNIKLDAKTILFIVGGLVIAFVVYKKLKKK